VGCGPTGATREMRSTGDWPRAASTSAWRRYSTTGFVKGYAVLEGAVDPAACDRFRDDISTAWEEGDERLFVRHPGVNEYVLLRAGTRTDGSCVVDSSVYYESAWELLFADAIVEFLRTIFEEEPLVFQSLSFDKGSEQGMHQRHGVRGHERTTRVGSRGHPRLAARRRRAVLPRRAGRGSSAARASRLRARTPRRPPGLRRERRLDAVRDHPHVLLVDAEELDRLAGRELRDRDHPRRRPRQSRQEEPAVAPRPAVERLRTAEHSKVVESEHERNTGSQRAEACGAVEDVDAVAGRPPGKGAEILDGVADHLPSA
jgi:hypothetical protein